ncbi:hypothetical protein [Mycobacterium malmoense]|uniref:hypothetical protein n=1 Tax=Mycobacterium malmoense TaxID=1780 RepID=UPI0008F86B18|nr:hypothetical protein [Mycobacterium malmoense]OIN79791.1 hypothetical protein BMG05_16735 [Mycobacterium malmoense]
MRKLPASDRIRVSAQIHGWRYSDPGDVAWRDVHESYRKGHLFLAVRYDQRGAIHHAYLMTAGEDLAAVEPRDKFKASTVCGWLGDADRFVACATERGYDAGS